MRFGIDYGGTNIKTGLFDEDGTVVSFSERKLTDFTSGDLLQNLIAHAKSVIEGYSISRGGLAIKGLINSETGVLLEDIGAGSLLAGIPLGETFSEALGFPFSVENDARSFAWGEYKFGAGKGSKAMVCMTLGTGLGCTLVTDNRTFCGADVLGGLLGGHISIDRNGPECPCGNIGCLELYCSATALVKRVNDRYPEFQAHESSLPLYFDRVRAGDARYLPEFVSFINDLSIGVVNVIHAYGADVVVLGGGVLNSSDIILPPLTELVHRRAWTYPKNKVLLKPAALGNKSAALGVAFL